MCPGLVLFVLVWFFAHFVLVYCALYVYRRFLCFVCPSGKEVWLVRLEEWREGMDDKWQAEETAGKVRGAVGVGVVPLI